MNSYRLSETQLWSLHFRLKKDPDLLRDYDKIIQEQEHTGIVERVPEEESSSNVDKEEFYYSPHHTVIRKDRETTKVRMCTMGQRNLLKKNCD